MVSLLNPWHPLHKILAEHKINITLLTLVTKLKARHFTAPTLHKYNFFAKRKDYLDKLVPFVNLSPNNILLSPRSFPLPCCR